MPRVLRNRKCSPELETADRSEPQKKRNRRCKPAPETKPKSGSSSDSDIEDYLKKPEDLDLNSTFFQPCGSQPETFDSIEKDIFNGIDRLSDSNSESDEIQTETQQINAEENVEAPTWLERFHKYNAKLEEAKKHVDEYKAKMKDRENDDISNILSVGESKDSGLHSSDFESCSESEDWEEVEVGEAEQKEIHSTNGVEITLQGPNVARTKKSVDLMAAFKRRMNRIKKENQVYVHKVHVLCWIAHGNYINTVLSRENLLGLSLSLLPSQHCYPSNRVDLEYLEKILQWYKKAVRIVKSDGGDDCLEEHLEKEIVAREVFNYKHLVYIFICVLRSMGLKCRLVISLQVEPLRPPSSELCSLRKNDGEGNETDKPSKSGKKTTAKKIKLDKEINPKSNSPKSLEIERRQDQIVDEKVHKAKQKISEKIAANLGSVRQKKSTESKTNVPKNPRNKTTSQTRSVVQNETQSCNLGKRPLKTNEPKVTTQTKSSFIIKSKQEKKSEVPRLKDVDETKIAIDSTMDNDATKRKDFDSSSGDEVVIPQLDGGNDTDGSSKSPKSKKPNINKLKSQGKNPCSKAHPKRLKILHKVTESDEEFRPRSPLTVKNNRFASPKTSNVNSPADLNIQPSGSQAKLERKFNLKLLSKESKSMETARTSTHDLRKRINLRQLSNQTSSSSVDVEAKRKKQIDVRNDIISLITKDVKQRKGVALGKLAEHKRKSAELTLTDNDSDYAPELCKKKNNTTTKVKRRVPMKKDLVEIERNEAERKLQEKNKKDVNVWIEVFSEAEEKWISVDVVKGQIHCVKELHNRATHPISYIFAWDNDNYIKDITKRYCVNWNTVTRKLRCNTTWLDAALKSFIGPKTFRDKEEDEELATQQLEQPLPTTISEYKNHPLYVLKRHLLKFEAIYPPDALTLGFVRNEPVYSRDCVHVLHSRDIWLKHAKVVKLGETPYKIVKARPKYDKLSNSMITDKLLEIFGKWQVQDYDPPTAENGVVPRNAYGNVELFKACMLPKGTVHLQLPGLNKVARKLNVDCAPAMTGFDYHSGWSHPTFDGFVVCKEHEEILIAGWYMEQEEAEKRAEEKVEKRVYGNWRRLIKGLLIRERLKARYDFGYETKGGNSKTKAAGSRLCLKKRRGSDSDSDEGKK